MNQESRTKAAMRAAAAVAAQATPAGGAAPDRTRLPVHPVLLLGALVTVVAAVAASLLPQAAAGALWDLAQVVVVGLALAMLLVGWRAARGDRRLAIGATVGAMLLAGSGMALQVAVPTAGGAGASTFLHLLAVVMFVTLFSAAISAGLGRLLLIGSWLDALIVFVAASVVVGVAWTALSTPVGVATLAALQLLLVLGAWSASAALVLLARGMRPAPGGPWAMLGGALCVAVGGAAWWVTMAAGEPPTALQPSGLLLPAGMLLAAHGSLTWSLGPADGGPRERAARRLADAVPLAGVAVVLALDVLTIGRSEYLFVGTGLVLVLLLVGVRHAVLRSEGRRLEASRRVAEARLLIQTSDRDTALRSMTRLEAGDSLRETAGRIVAEALTLGGIDAAWVSTIGDDGQVRVLATAGLPAGVLVGRTATPGPGSAGVEVGSVTVWVEHPVPGGTGHLADLAACGVIATLVAPYRWEERLAGHVALGTRSDGVAATIAQRAATARELAVVAASLMGPTIAADEQARRSRAEIDALIADHSFYPVFQPIADLATGRVAGYEALTRFTDGRRPDVVFEVARVAGRGRELEVATLAAAISASSGLDPDCYLSLNLSPDLAVAPELLGPLLLDRVGRELVLEITEHVPVADYERLVATLYALDLRIRIAVDDAGAGYAGLQHILAIRPQLVKLDIGLVRSVDVDIARQALIGGMVSFARRVGAKLVAEGVERQAEADMLRSLGVDLVQGYLVGRPARVADQDKPWADAPTAEPPAAGAPPS